MFECFVEIEDFFGFFLVQECVGGEGFECVQSDRFDVVVLFYVIVVVCVVDENFVYGDCCDGEEFVVVLCVQMMEFEQLKVGFVDECCGGQCVVLFFGCVLVCCYVFQFVVEKRQQFIEGLVVFVLEVM